MKSFWDEQAEKFKGNVNAVNFDPLSEELELFSLEGMFRDGDIVCDVGSGNGRTLLHLAQRMPAVTFYGVDYSEKMVQIANEKKKELGISNVSFQQFDASSSDLKSLFSHRFDKVLSKRLLINLKGRAKYLAAENIHAMLKEGGIYIMIECFLEPLGRINAIRGKLGLEQIAVKHFNEYLTEDFLNNIADKFLIVEQRDYESFYYFISRIFNAHLSGGKPEYLAPINRLAADMVKMGVVSGMAGYSPQIMHILKRK